MDDGDDVEFVEPSTKPSRARKPIKYDQYFDDEDDNEDDDWKNEGRKETFICDILIVWNVVV